MTTSAPDPRASARARDTSDGRRRPHWPIAIAAAASVLAVVSAVGYVGSRQTTVASSSAMAAGTTTTVPQTEAVDSPASARLVAVADLISTMTVFEEPGTYVYHETEHWSRRDGTEIIGFHDISWHAADGFTRVIEQRLPAQPAAGFDLDQIGHTSFDTAPPVISEYDAAEVRSFTERHGAPPSDDPELLTRQLDAESGGPGPGAPCPPACGRQTPPHVFLDNVIGLHRTEFLDFGTRVAVLRIVATLPGLAGGTEVTDRAGRPGIAVWLDHQGVRQTLIFDPNTGHFLASERSVPGFVLDDYTLYLDCGYRDTLD